MKYRLTNCMQARNCQNWRTNIDQQQLSFNRFFSPRVCSLCLKALNDRRRLLVTGPILIIISVEGEILRSLALSFRRLKCASKMNTCLNRNSGCGLISLAAEAAVLHSTCFLLKNCNVPDRCLLLVLNLRNSLWNVLMLAYWNVSSLCKTNVVIMTKCKRLQVKMIIIPNEHLKQWSRSSDRLNKTMTCIVINNKRL